MNSKGRKKICCTTAAAEALMSVNEEGYASSVSTVHWSINSVQACVSVQTQSEHSVQACVSVQNTVSKHVYQVQTQSVHACASVIGRGVDI